MNETLNILLVDDDEVDVFAVQRTIRKQKITNPLHIAQDGREALEMLRGTSDRPPLPQPLIILLDLNMPRMGGLEFLREVRADPAHEDLSIFVLTTSDDPRDRRAAAEYNVSGYLLKDELEDRLLDLITGRYKPSTTTSSRLQFRGPDMSTLPPDAVNMVDPLEAPEPLDVGQEALIEERLGPDELESSELLDVVEALPDLEPMDLLLVDDDAVDAMALRRALSRRGQPHRLHVETDGVNALKRLRGVRGVEPLPRPLVILLDLSLPRMHGSDVLKELRRDPTLRHHVVFVLSTSEDPRDVADAYSAQVAGYLPKGRLGEGWDLLVHLLDAYLRIVQLPQD